MQPAEHVLVVDDDEPMREMLRRVLKAEGYEVLTAHGPPKALELLEAHDVGLVVTDVRMGTGDGLALCRQIVDIRPDLPVIVITAFGSLDTAVEAIRSGATDFVTKPFDLDLIRHAVARAWRQRLQTRRIERLESALGERAKGGAFGSSRVMREIEDLVGRIAPTETNVLVQGESGTGKELVAREIHRRSRRREGPFVAVNCAAMPDTLLESELFGHEKGAFTDARTRRAGLFEEARGGTLFLDEIGELPLPLQPKLLRVLQERTFRPLGAGRDSAFEGRLVCATNRDLEAQVAASAFREDLYYRVAVVQIELPPLRLRGDDVLLLARLFLVRFAQEMQKPVHGIVPAAQDLLLHWSWPGNVRELQNCIERAVALTRHTEIGPEDLPERIRTAHRPDPVGPLPPVGELPTMEEVERRYVLQVYESTGHNKALTARILGFNRKTLYRRLQSYGVPLDGEG